jgi:hypothetical protein
VARPWPGGEKRRGGRAAHHEELCSDWVVSPPVCGPGMSLLAVWCLIGATPRGQPWTPAVTLPLGCDRLSARRMAVWWTFREPSLCRHVRHELMRNAFLDFTLIIPATACHQRNYECVPPFTPGVCHWAVRLMMPTMIRALHAVTLTPPAEVAADFPGAGGHVYSWPVWEAVCPCAPLAAILSVTYPRAPLRWRRGAPGGYGAEAVYVSGYGDVSRRLCRLGA